MIKLFFSYSHKDEVLRDELQTHLALLQHQNIIGTWHDRRITAGEELDPAILSNLEEADIILLLVSADFIASKYCWGVEIQRAMERHEAHEAVVIPVILRSCSWHTAPFGKLLAAPTDGRPVTKWPDRDEAFLNVTEMIQSAISKIQKVYNKKSVSKMQSTDQTPRVNKLRSSNLAIPKKFTQADEDQFMHDAFEYIRNYFEGSLEALSERNQEITTRFRHIDANRFTAVAYHNGNKTSACTIWQGGDGFMTGIKYFGGDTGGTNTFHEILNVGHDEHSFYLKTMNAFNNKDQKLTMEGGAEHFWAYFIDRLRQGSR